MKRTSEKSFLRQLIQSFIFVIMIPVLCLGGYTFYAAHNYIREQRIAEAVSLIKQNQRELDSWAKQCETSVRYLTANYTLQEFLQMDESQYVAVNQSARIVSTVLYGVLLSTQDYEKITVYTDKEFNCMSRLLKNTQEVEQETWYQDILEVTGTYWWYQDGHFYVGKKIVTSYPVKVIGVLVIEMKEDIFDKSFSMLEHMPVKMRLKCEEVSFYEYMTEAYREERIESDEGKESGEGKETGDNKENRNNKENGLLQELSWGNTGWVLEYEVDESYYEQRDGIALWLPMVVIGIVLVLALLCMRLLASFLVKDLKALVAAVNEVQSGNLDVEFKLSGTREIRILEKSIGSMLHRIKQLIHQVYEKEIESQKLELNLLQSKISPHFLYNNLSMINWMAIDCGEDKISDIVTEMAAFYRTALNKGKTVDRLCVELDNIKAYVNLVLYAREVPFTVAYDIDETLLDVRVPTFILQPLVENAIEHGIDQLGEEAGKLIITAEGEAQELFLKVYDNGKALYQRIGKGMLARKEYGYGTGNVDRRIQLMFGTAYGLEIYADEKGTMAIIHLKKPNDGEIINI